MLRSPLLARSILLIGSTALALVLLEIGLRVLYGGPMSEQHLRERLRQSADDTPVAVRDRSSLFGLVRSGEHPDVVYELKPNLRVLFRAESLATNSMGLRRADDVPLEKPEGVVRIIGLGDSHMFGWGVSQEETYLHQLELLLNRGGGESRFEVFNCAAPGYNTVLEVAIYEHKCAHLDPDLVVLHFIDNDLELPHFLQGTSKQDSSSTRSMLVATIRALVGAGQPAESSLVGRNRLKDLSPEERAATRGRYRHMEGIEGFLAALDRLAELTAAKQVPVLVLIFGNLVELRLVVAEEARARGFEVVTAIDSFYDYLVQENIEPSPENWKQLYRLPRDDHPTALAHQRYAELLVEPVRRLLRPTGS